MAGKKASLQCGSCLNLEYEKAFEKPCAQLGKVCTSKACSSSYVPNVRLFAHNEDNSRIESLAHGIRGLSDTELQALAGVLLCEKKTRRSGWSFYDKVYVRYQGSYDRDYMSNFLVGHVVYADKEFVRVIGNSGKMFLTLPNEKDGNTLYTPARFKLLREAMKTERHFVDTQLAKSMQVASSRGGNVATLDEVLELEALKSSLHAESSRTDDLVAISAKVSKGIILSGRRTKSATKRTVKDTSHVSEITFKG